MDMPFIKLHKRGFFSHHKKLGFNVEMTIDNKTAIFIFYGPSKEVEDRFHHVLQILHGRKHMTDPAPVDHYQVDGHFSSHYKGAALYRIGIKLNAENALLNMFWYLTKTWPKYNDHTILAYASRSEDFAILEKAAHKAKNIDDMLPAFRAPKGNSEQTVKHHRFRL